MKQNYEKRIASLTEREHQLSDELRENYLRESTLKKANANLENISVISDLTVEVVDALIDRILLFEDKHIEVKFKFSDETLETQMNGRYIWKRNRPKKVREGAANG
jgi:uncharacterized protein YnzC (UPF0291/DUF896 family)